MARNGTSKPNQTSLQGGEDYISLVDGPASSSKLPDLQRRGVKRKAAALDEEDTRQKLRLNERATPWMSSIPAGQHDMTIDILNAEVHAFRNFILPTDEEHSVRLMVVECIRRSITRKWPSAEVLAFGSQETRLYFPNGDIDLVVHYPGVSVDRKEQVVAFLTEISHLLQKARVSRRINIIGRARVPIIKFVTDLGHYAVDISVNQTNGIRAITVVNRFLRHMPAVRSLVMVIKAFLLERGLNEPYSGGFGSYTVICMVVNFLQMHPKVRRREIDPNRNLGVLLLDFLQLYGHLFNYNDVGISVRNGGSYFLRQNRGWASSEFKNASRMQISVEDPVDPSNDVAKSSSAGKVKDAFAAAFESLSTSVIVRAQELDARRNDTSLSRGSTGSKQVSLLGSVVGLPQDMLNFRREVNALFRSGSLQNFLGLPRSGLWPPPGPVQQLEDLHTGAQLRSLVERPLPAKMGVAIEGDNEDSELVITIEAEPSPESRYSLVQPTRTADTAVVYEEDQSLSEMSLSPKVGLSDAVYTEESMLSRDAKRAFWAAKGPGDGEVIEDEADRWENDA
ncbi:Nucleotidyltransferase [Calocera cornea HHB12733]|uniref:polynucleotide adenylyltransferase n=1 Tax=Calocera cornea HHB12733 TaxID=1353952 RepID=A0A165J9M0_9BASI|nr:Nucleotidyltransferase [Calocera cornea HHB12733]